MGRRLQCHSAMMAWVPMPLALRRTIRARRTLLPRSVAIRSQGDASPPVSRIENKMIPWRMRQTSTGRPGSGRWGFPGEPRTGRGRFLADLPLSASCSC